MKNSLWTAGLSVALALVVGACSGSQTKTETAKTDAKTETAKPAGPNDAQIAAIAVAANQVDIDAGKVAAAKSKNKAIKQFANQMVTDHQGVLKQAGDLVAKLGLTPEENDTSRSLVQGGKDNIENLNKLKAKDFDKAYIDHEVAYHEQVIDAVDNTLIPNAKNAELKALLEKVSPVLKAHLEHAKQVQSGLSSGGKGGAKKKKAAGG